MKVYPVTHPSEAAQAYPCATEGEHFWAEGLPISRAWFALGFFAPTPEARVRETIRREIERR